MQDQLMNGWTVLNALVLGLPATIAAIAAAIRSANNGRKIDDNAVKLEKVNKNVNGRMGDMVRRNRQLAALLSQNNIPIPAELVIRSDDAGNS